jgi:hypothetical protein
LDFAEDRVGGRQAEWESCQIQSAFRLVWGGKDNTHFANGGLDMTTKSIKLLLLAVLMAFPFSAHAQMFSAYVMGKSDFTRGTGAAFARFDQGFGTGAEAGVEIIGIDLWGEALSMGSEQYMFTANLGYDQTFGKKWRFTVGAYTGPMVFMFPREESEPFQMSGTLRSALTASGVNPGRIEETYNDELRSKEDEISQYALGWNLARARVQMERKLVSKVFMGFSVQAAYHYLLNGDQIAADAKHQAVDDIDERFGLSEISPMIPQQIRTEIGAQELQTGKMDGLNYNLGAYLKVEI